MSECTWTYLRSKNLAEFAKAFASAVVGTLDTPVEKTMATVARFFRSCRPTITPQEDGLPKFSFDIVPQKAEESIAETFAYLKKRDRRIVIAIGEIVSELVEDRSMVFRDLYFSQNESAQQVLSAIASDGNAKGVFSGDFLTRHRLSAVSSVRSALKVLLDKDLVYRTDDGYVVYDRIFGEWLRRK